MLINKLDLFEDMSTVIIIFHAILDPSGLLLHELFAHRLVTKHALIHLLRDFYYVL